MNGETPVVTYGVHFGYYKIILEESTVVTGHTMDLHNHKRDERTEKITRKFYSVTHDYAPV